MPFIEIWNRHRNMRSSLTFERGRSFISCCCAAIRSEIHKPHPGDCQPAGSRAVPAAMGAAKRVCPSSPKQVGLSFPKELRLAQ